MEEERETEKLRKHGRKPREISQLFAINSLSSHSGSLLLYISKTQPPRAEQHHSQIPPSAHRATLPLTALRVQSPGPKPEVGEAEQGDTCGFSSGLIFSPGEPTL